MYARTDVSDRPVSCPERVPWKLVTYMWKFECKLNRCLPYLREKYPHVVMWDITSDKDEVAFMARIAELHDCGERTADPRAVS